MGNRSRSFSFWVPSLLVLLVASLAGLSSQRPPDWLLLPLMLAGAALLFWVLARALDENKALLFLGVCLVVAFGFEWFAVNRSGLLTHNTRPQIAGVPVPVLLGWFVAVAASFSLAAALLGRRDIPVTAGATALLATLFDFTFDPMGLGNGWWQWQRGGGYAMAVRGANDVMGIPWSNFVGWLLLSVLVVTAFELLTRKRARDRQIFVRDTFDLHLTALIYFALCMPGLLWALRTRHWALFLWPAVALGVLAYAVMQQLRRPRRR